VTGPPARLVGGGLRIAITGLAATYPIGGVFWDYLQYPLGFRRLGHDVLYLEDTGRWCYDPAAGTFVESGAANAGALARHLAALDAGLADRWFFRDATGATYGLSWPDVVAFCRTADVFIHVSASCWMREEYFAAGRVVFIDSDPMFTQASVPDAIAGTASDEARSRLEMLRRHDVFFTFAENVGAADCRVPTDMFAWIPTRQPIVLDCFETEEVPLSGRRRMLTTVGSWEREGARTVVAGVPYHGKDVEFERFIDLPGTSALPLEIALSGRAPVERLRARGWRVVDAAIVSNDPWRYRAYLAHSLGEWSVAKHAYVAARTGWFSCRSACYLALGVPVIVQDTGFGSAIPSGRGVLAFSTADEAADAIGDVAADPARHAKAAREIARAYFGADAVLTSLLDRALADPAAA
jgi:hypothetical protein